MIHKIKEIIKNRPLIIDGAMGTQLQLASIEDACWKGEDGADLEGCNELLNVTAPELIKEIYSSYARCGADLITTNTFGCMPWVLDEYDIGNRAYELTLKSVQLAREVCDEFSTQSREKFVLGTMGPGTKLPSLGHISYDKIYEGYKITAQAMVDGGVDIFLLETCQDPLQIKAALHAIQDISSEIPIMVSVTIELTGSMLIGTDASTIATILEPFNILSLGFSSPFSAII